MFFFSQRYEILSQIGFTDKSETCRNRKSTLYSRALENNEKFHRDYDHRKGSLARKKQIFKCPQPSFYGGYELSGESLPPPSYKFGQMDKADCKTVNHHPATDLIHC